MNSVMTTRMSSRGQVVLPEALRQKYGWDAGTSFTVLVYKGAVIMQPLAAPSEAELAAEFEAAFAESRQQAKTAGMKPGDVAAAVKAVRINHRLRRARR